VEIEQQRDRKYPERILAEKSKRETERTVRKERENREEAGVKSDNLGGEE
jgi:hypothetical protein